MLRILQVVNIMNRAGIETMLMNYYRNIDREQIQFDFLTHRPDKGDYENEIILLGGRVYHAPRLYPQNYLKYFEYLKTLFEQHPEYKIIHSHIDSMTAFPLYAARKSRIPIRIAHSHTTELDLDFKLPIKMLAKNLVPQMANVYCACGMEAGRFLFGKRKFKLVRNAIDIDKFRFDSECREKKRRELQINDEFVVGHVGRYSAVKNQSFLIDIFLEILRKNPNSILLLIGKGEDEYILKKKSKELHLNEKIRFLSDRSDVNELYQSMDVFVMPSMHEGLPLVGVEAQANGLPCIVSDAISDEILMTDSIKRISLKQPPTEWARLIMSVSKERNKMNISYLRKNGYDIKTEAPKLMRWYKNMADELQYKF